MHYLYKPRQVGKHPERWWKSPQQSAGRKLLRVRNSSRKRSGATEVGTEQGKPNMLCARPRTRLSTTNQTIDHDDVFMMVL